MDAERDRGSDARAARTTRRRITTFVALGACAAATIVAASCSSDVTGTNGPTTTFGPSVTLGNGVARAYVITQSGAPSEIGMSLSAAALDGLPTAPLMGGYEYLLPLPSGNTTQYQVVALNWNPTGHPPPMVYTVPHFDFHFYMTSLAERNAIDASDTAFNTKAGNLPSSALRPTNYVADPPANAIPHMGLHWTDSSATEFHGQPFTRTFIFGSWNGQFTFLEPMVTRAYLLTHPNDVTAVHVPSQGVSGYYPAAYRVAWDSTTTEWRIALTQLAR